MRPERLLPVLLLLAVPACQPSCQPTQAVNFRQRNGIPQIFARTPVLWSLDCAFPPKTAPQARDAFRYWNLLLGWDLFQESEQCGAFGAAFRGSPFVLVAWFDAEHEDGPEIMGSAQTDGFGSTVESGRVGYYRSWSNALSDSVRLSAARHEVGHVVGFDHSDFKRCLMYGSLDSRAYESRPKAACKEEVDEVRKQYPKREGR